MNGINEEAANRASSPNIGGIGVNATGKKMRILFTCFVTLLLILTASLPLIAEETQRGRGIFPKCQITCLSAHNEKMKTLAEKYGIEKKMLSFQDNVDNALDEYSICLHNCRLVLPVK